MDKRLLALPEMDVSGVLKSCEIARSRFARNCSIFCKDSRLLFLTGNFSHFPKPGHILREWTVEYCFQMDQEVFPPSRFQQLHIPYCCEQQGTGILHWKAFLLWLRHVYCFSIPSRQRPFHFRKIHDSKFSSVTEKNMRRIQHFAIR